jgi:hypothetical protein
MTVLTLAHVRMVVNDYIGVTGGLLGDFTHNTHAQFYPEYCGLKIATHRSRGTIREQFMEILRTAEPVDQAKILRGVLELFTLDAEPRPATRTPQLRAEIERLIAGLSGGPQITSPSLATQTDVVERALRDAEMLIVQQGATSAVDRIHTALHAYLASLCDAIDNAVAPDASLTALFKTLRQHHPALKATGPRSEDIDTILRAFANVLDALNPIRNKASLAHPQPALLGQPEAMVAVHAARTVLHYIDARCRADAADSEATW